jgi:hypothetical protein
MKTEQIFVIFALVISLSACRDSSPKPITSDSPRLEENAPAAGKPQPASPNHPTSAKDITPKAIPTDVQHSLDTVKEVNRINRTNREGPLPVVPSTASTSSAR